LTTSDGGTAWQFQITPWDRFLADISLIDKDHCWIAGRKGGILKLTNDLKTVSVVYTQLQINFQAVWFVNPNEGWAVSDNGSIAHSSDGGDTWTIQFLGR